jgi:hypothetical protein
MEKKFKKGEVVWAKVRGFPWWPGVVKSLNLSNVKQDEEDEVKQATVLIYFIGDDSHSELPINKIEKFSLKLEEYSKTKKKALLNSIKIAEKIIAGDIPFEKHLHFVQKRKKKIHFKKDSASSERKVFCKNYILGE